MSLSISKLKNILHTSPTDGATTTQQQRKANKANNNERLEPEVGFKLTLDPGSCADYDEGEVVEGGSRKSQPPQTNESSAAAIPELQVHLVGARHLPTSFGLKSVEGYMIKIKLFPGAAKFDSSIQTTSWPTFGETFRFPLAASHKSSFRVKKNQPKVKPDETVPEKLFNGNFVVFTVFALLELPPGYTSTLKNKTMTFIRQGSQRLKDKPVIGKLVKDVDPPDAKNGNFDQKHNLKKLTTSESQRNIGSVTYFLEPKAFNEMCRGRLFTTEEMWLPIKDITMTQPAETRMQIFQSPKGQVEVTLQLCDYTEVNFDSSNPSQEDLSFNIDGPYSPTSSTSSSSASSPLSRFKKQPSCGSPVPNSISHKNRFSFDNVKKLVKSVKNKDKNHKGLCLKIYTSKIRCGIKVKEEFEEVSEKIYLKTTVLEHEILSASWKSEPFRPTLSARWNPEDCTIVMPLSDESCLEYVSIRVAMAAKNKVGKKVYLGQVFLGPNAPTSNPIKQDQWRKMIAYKGSPISIWHNFE
ncbi:uncharacterized protein LOC129768053 [Toxorhynchites rutilus septentrionalis]|uniref:uncharacterized protein LOC129768053 n=1 Tax=Toxorhynchites rutilus septentrionalis TaxID=329112 RepID=UPI00247B2099|nr:uncharacterized protein LOC129768053 [Toxorhynchites rutilus septentrionalis]XP_055625403.1 uncharacterized protein LOC129768053 [Toxorhynchites rutilus septentrionalis]XP_055625404.1 uncharacterized protein LOC129768053 [Toxorhynchites rutilus septentrionalis]XP_055625405.1 uncharacterized protein LOC129768053 [Toxorhynchites rutilus septentrionalis]XP_055625406.1 uncharacterized protein LOC129768053 [Toxorhynchites rutilus septentrionalis]XP_055625407.1 uncharacterized protein LOC12976805